MNKLLSKYINGNCTDEEKIEITNWIDSDPKNMQEYLKLRKLNDISNWGTNFTPKLGLAKTNKGKVPLSFSKNFYKEVLKIAAIFIFAFFILRNISPEIISHFETTKMQTLHVPAGQRADIMLEDGTKVWLNANSTLTFPSHFSDKNRTVCLDGEGFFEVKHNKSKPFIVEGGKYNVKVLGTKFNLITHAEKKNFETSLLDGSVEIMKKNSSSGFVLKPNEQATLKDNVMVISSIRNVDHFLWREGIISLDDVTFIELIEKLEFYFDINIEMKNEQLLSSRYTGKFRMKDGVDHILKVLQFKNGFKYKIDEKRNKITIE